MYAKPLHTYDVYSKKEVVSLPFSSESQETISKNSFLCFMNIVTCDRGVGRRTPFIRKKGNVTDFCRSPFFGVQLYEQLWFN
ncbi:MAG TPA: hypothetical protein DCX11_07530 [Enterococcus sp.]|nr:hypothetical protein [Enterococcus sp.]